MTPTIISSLQHPLIKHLVRLRQDKAYRQSHGCAVISGHHLVREVTHFTTTRTLLVEVGTEIPYKVSADRVYQVERNVVKKITGQKEPQPVVAEVSLPPCAQIAAKKRIVVIDGVSDPGNVGTLLRTALGLGWEAAFLLEGCADPFNERALRAGMGAPFRLPLSYGSYQDLLSLPHALWVAEASGTEVTLLEVPKQLALVIGNESSGVSLEAKMAAAHSVSIPMHGDMESLNAAVAGAIIMYAVGRGL